MISGRHSIGNSFGAEDRELGWSQRELAKKLGVTPGSWANETFYQNLVDKIKRNSKTLPAKQNILWRIHEKKESMVSDRLEMRRFNIQVDDGETRVTPLIKISRTI